MEIKNINEQKPRMGHNVFVKHSIHQQDFWTRGFLIEDEWTIMTWTGTKKIPISKISEWAEIPNVNYL